MSWGAQNRSKDAKTPSASRGMSEKTKLELCGIQPYTLTRELDLLSLVDIVVLVQNFTSSYLFEMILAVETVEILYPEVNRRSSHNTKTISISICSIAREGAP
jgi:hypothetical protein